MTERVHDRGPTVTRQLAAWLLVAAWSAVAFGILEGAVLAAARLDPRILAPGKVSNDILWVAPLVNMPAFLLAALAGGIAYRLAPERLRRWPGERVAIGIFVFLGAFSVIFSPRLLGAFGTIVLALGLAVAAMRLVEGREQRLWKWMRRRLPWMPVALVIIALAVFGHDRWQERRAAAALAESPEDAINVLVLMLDTVRDDRFTADRAPNLTRLASTGAQFENAWSTTSWSLPSQASVLTGRYPFAHGADFPGIALDRDALTLGEYLGRRGYATGAFSSNAAWIVPEHLGRGFVRFEAYILEDLARRTVTGRVAERVLNRLGYHKAGRGKEATVLSAQFLRFVDDYSERPFFGYLCYMDVNRNMHRRSLGDAFWETPATREEILAAYDSALTALDEQIGDLLEELDRRGKLATTMIIVTSDHGESFGAGMLADHDPEGHGTSLYPEQVRVPLFVVMPGAVDAAQHSERVVSIRDIPATVAALLGDSGRPFEGTSLLNPGASGSDTPELSTLDYADRRIRSVMWNGWQYLAYPDEPEREELFDLRADPGATRNLRESAAGQLAAARASLVRLHPPAAAPGEATASHSGSR
jgi:arylsulfatase A-like enzyme